MNTAGDSADRLISLYLDGVEHAFRIAGAGAKNIAVMIYAMLDEQSKIAGKTNLKNMLKTEKELKIYSFKAEDMEEFAKRADNYGILYCVLTKKKDGKLDGIVDVMIKEEDAHRVNRIVEKFNFADVDTASIARELEKEKNKEVEKKSEEEILVDDILSSPTEEQEQQIYNELSPSFENTEEKSQSEISLNTKSNEKNKIKNKEEKRSVREELKEIEKEVKQREAEKAKERDEIVIENTPIMEKEKEKKEPKHLKEKEKQKPKHFKEPKHLDNTKRRKKKKSKKKER